MKISMSVGYNIQRSLFSFFDVKTDITDISDWKRSFIERNCVFHVCGRLFGGYANVT